MSKLLIDESPLVVLPSLACKIGLNEAVVLQQIHYWAGQSKNELEGHKWVYNSVSEWRRQFPFWSEQTIRRALATLKERGLLVAKCLSPDPFNRTPYYRIDHEALAAVEHSKLEPTNNHSQSGIYVDTKLEPTVDTKLEPTSNTETNHKTSSETSRAALPLAPTPLLEKSGVVQGDLLGDALPAAPKKTKTVKTEAFDPTAILLALGVDEQIAADWLALRKKKRADVSLTVLDAAKDEAAKAGATLTEFLRAWCLSGWQGYKAEWYVRDKPAPGRPQGGGIMTMQERNRAISEANMRAFLEDDVTPCGVFDSLPPPNDPMTIDMVE
jgi:hypothetical protein